MPERRDGHLFDSPLERGGWRCLTRSGSASRETRSPGSGRWLTFSWGIRKCARRVGFKGRRGGGGGQVYIGSRHGYCPWFKQMTRIDCMTRVAKANQTLSGPSLSQLLCNNCRLGLCQTPNHGTSRRPKGTGQSDRVH